MKKSNNKFNLKLFFLASIVIFIAYLGLYYIYSGQNDLAMEEETLEKDVVEIVEHEEDDRELVIEEEVLIDNIEIGGKFELPINGASGYINSKTLVHGDDKEEGNILGELLAGSSFIVLEEAGDWWKVQADDLVGFINHEFAMINLPDIIPSIVYKNTNAEKSVMVSSGKDIPNITGQKLYDSYFFNERLAKKEFIMPVLYSMSKKIMRAQEMAILNGDTLVLYEAYRPASAQKQINSNLKKLAEIDKEVKVGISTKPWSMTWFINTGISNHQLGGAIDVSLAKLISREERNSGDFIYFETTNYKEYRMPTDIHELSIASRIFDSPVSSTSKTAWESATPSYSMNEEALKLQSYCARADLTPLASEWWHFNDWDSLIRVKDRGIDGKFLIAENKSKMPFYDSDENTILIKKDDM